VNWRLCCTEMPRGSTDEEFIECHRFHIACELPTYSNSSVTVSAITSVVSFEMAASFCRLMRNFMASIETPENLSRKAFIPPYGKHLFLVFSTMALYASVAEISCSSVICCCTALSASAAETLPSLRGSGALLFAVFAERLRLAFSY